MSVKPKPSCISARVKPNFNHVFIRTASVGFVNKQTMRPNNTGVRSKNAYVSSKLCISSRNLWDFVAKTEVETHLDCIVLSLTFQCLVSCLSCNNIKKKKPKQNQRQKPHGAFDPNCEHKTAETRQ